MVIALVFLAERFWLSAFHIGPAFSGHSAVATRGRIGLRLPPTTPASTVTEPPVTRQMSQRQAQPGLPGDPGSAWVDMSRYDIFARFAERHLSTDAERAIYLVLVSQQARLWSAAELASQTGLQPDEAQRVLTRYLAANIVQNVASTESRRYRWRSDMNYLLGEDAHGSPWLDPVCDMPVTADSPYQADADGQTWKFCSSVCLTLFAAAPDRFAGPAARQ